MEIVEFIGIKKRKVKIPCTACGGKGKIPYIDLSEPQEEVEIEVTMSLSIADGWRKSSEWKRAHYIADGRSLCGSIRSQKILAQSTIFSDLDSDILCSTCARMIVKKSS
jgi:hypothetical protein